MIGVYDMFYGVIKLFGGLVFSLGLILVVIIGGELFISLVLILVVKVSGKILWKELVCNWMVVYFGNLCGLIILVFIMFVIC